jgi:hypothetical protein
MIAQEHSWMRQYGFSSCLSRCRHQQKGRNPGVIIVKRNDEAGEPYSTAIPIISIVDRFPRFVELM